MENDDLEKALNNATGMPDGSTASDGSNSGSSDGLSTGSMDGSASQGGEVGKMSEEEEKGFHKGALNTLVAERNELGRDSGIPDILDHPIQFFRGDQICLAQDDNWFDVAFFGRDEVSVEPPDVEIVVA